ncbi:MAG: Transcriptional regulator MraZ [Chlamydiia bacterium]|nr:Transcriptional regulator MraZ [Chlamydiia bacterium]
MSETFFSGSFSAKLDEKNRFVLPQNLRYGLVEDGKLEFTIALSMGGCLAIYRKSDIDAIVKRFKEKQHIAKYQKFFTLFFSTLVHTTCDKVGRITLPTVLKNGVKIKTDMIIAGAMNKIELWPKEVYEKDLQDFLSGEESGGDFSQMMEEAFGLLGNDKEQSEVKDDTHIERAIERVQGQPATL